MAVKILKNLAVKTGSYTDRDGNEKGQYVNVGKIMQKEDGGQFMFIEAHINFAGFPRREGSSSVLVSMFDQKEDSRNGAQQVTNQTAAKFEDDDVPF